MLQELENVSFAQLKEKAQRPMPGVVFDEYIDFLRRSAEFHITPERSLEKLFTRYNRLQKAVRWTIGNDLPEDDLLESLTRFLTLEFKKYDSAPGGFKPCWWHSTQEYLHTLVRDHLNSVRQPSLDDLQAAAVDRDYFNNWTGQSKPKEQ